MAKSAVLTPKKKKTVRATRRLHGFALMPTDNFWKAKHFVHYEIESKDWASTVQKYILKYLDKTHASAIAHVPDWKLSYASHWATVAYWLMNDLSPPDAYVTAFKKYLENLAEEGKKLAAAKKEQATTKKNIHLPSIQDRIHDQVLEVCEDIEEWLEGFIKNKKTFDSNGFDFKSHFAKHEVSQAHARKIIKLYANEYSEAKLISTRPTPAQIAKIKDPKVKDDFEQLVEGYRHINKLQAQAYLQALENLISACNFVLDTSKATRKPRAKKVPSKDKLISKVKYKVSDDHYKLASINPIEIVGCEELWVFNTKTRKLGKYVAAEDAKVIGIKGTTLVGYDEEKSIQKTLRKPSETLKEFKEAGKVKLRKFLEVLPTTDTKLNGRINEDVILLKAISK
jgi:putative N-acetylmannosamine-6-phosphate epimerase